MGSINVRVSMPVQRSDTTKATHRIYVMAVLHTFFSLDLSQKFLDVKEISRNYTKTWASVSVTHTIFLENRLFSPILPRILQVHPLF
jgi:hypothetical protein